MYPKVPICILRYQYVFWGTNMYSELTICTPKQNLNYQMYPKIPIRSWIYTLKYLNVSWGIETHQDVSRCILPSKRYKMITSNISICILQKYPWLPIYQWHIYSLYSYEIVKIHLCILGLTYFVHGCKRAWFCIHQIPSWNGSMSPRMAWILIQPCLNCGVGAVETSEMVMLARQHFQLCSLLRLLRRSCRINGKLIDAY